MHLCTSGAFLPMQTGFKLHTCRVGAKPVWGQSPVSIFGACLHPRRSQGLLGKNITLHYITYIHTLERSTILT